MWLQKPRRLTNVINKFNFTSWYQELHVICSFRCDSHAVASNDQHVELGLRKVQDTFPLVFALKCTYFFASFIIAFLSKVSVAFPSFKLFDLGTSVRWNRRVSCLWTGKKYKKRVLSRVKYKQTSATHERIKYLSVCLLKLSSWKIYHPWSGARSALHGPHGPLFHEKMIPANVAPKMVDHYCSSIFLSSLLLLFIISFILYITHKIIISTSIPRAMGESWSDAMTCPPRGSGTLVRHGACRPAEQNCFAVNYLSYD